MDIGVGTPEEEEAEEDVGSIWRDMRRTGGAGRGGVSSRVMISMSSDLLFFVGRGGVFWTGSEGAENGENMDSEEWNSEQKSNFDKNHLVGNFAEEFSENFKKLKLNFLF